MNPDEYQNLAESLEEYASPRADFRHLSTEEREAIAQHLVRARSQARQKDDTDAEEWKLAGTWRSHLEEKKCAYMYHCGEHDIEMDEARSMWWEYVYDEAPPYMREHLV